MVGVAVLCATASLVSHSELHRRVLLCGGARLPFGKVQAVNFVGHAVAQTMQSAGSAVGSAYMVAAPAAPGVWTPRPRWSTMLATFVSAAGLVVIVPLALAHDGAARPGRPRSSAPGRLEPVRRHRRTQPGFGPRNAGRLCGATGSIVRHGIARRFHRVTKVPGSCDGRAPEQPGAAAVGLRHAEHAPDFLGTPAEIV